MIIESKKHGFKMLEDYQIKMKLSRATLSEITGISADLIRGMQSGEPPYLVKSRGIHVLRLILTLTGRGHFEAGTNSDVRYDLDAWAYYRDHMARQGHYNKDAAIMVGMKKDAFSRLFSGWYAEDQSHDGFGLMNTLSSLYNEPVFVGGLNET